MGKQRVGQNNTGATRVHRSEQLHPPVLRAQALAAPARALATKPSAST